MTVAGVLLAAGDGSRFTGDTHKLLADLGGRPVLAHALRAVVAAGLDELLVVTGAIELADHMPESVRVVHNPGWRSGQASSLQLAVEAAREAGHESIVVGLADQPFVGPRVWKQVATAPSAPIAAAVFAGQRRPPVRLDKAIWDQLPTEGDEGARTLIAAHPELVTEVPCVGDPSDIDTEETLQAMRETLSNDTAAVTTLLGRSPQGEFEVVVRSPDGLPVVLRNFPVLDDGRPMPTLYWLCGARENMLVGRLESMKGVRRAETDLGLDVINAAHDRYREERDAFLDSSAATPAHRPTGGVGGTRNGVKCLHAHYGWWLAGGDDPVGQWVAEHLHEVDYPEWPTAPSATEDTA
ncbi:MAG: DUF501 domain-containing protein [Acidimicrobiales bacterium]|nr:MAG: DUF501 domain-containing protein [Acidimicrobiales bacterium]